MATDGASCEPDLSRGPDDPAGATAEAAVTEFPGLQERCRRGLGVVPRSPPDTPRGMPGASLECPLTSSGFRFLPRGVPSQRFPLPSRGYPLPGVPLPLDTPSFPWGVPFECPFPGVPPRPEAGSSEATLPPPPPRC